VITHSIKGEVFFRHTAQVDVIELYDKPEAQILHMCIVPGGELKSHITPVDVAMYILEGEPTIMIGDERKVCTPGTMIESPKDIPHAIQNPSEETVKLLVMKLPKPLKQK
jgi:quercetin dioxygenase-like cupin family protein